ncbi:hypothetical protein OC834_007158 [Tilletia horrida]|nr:hypothetical protein OC834_007158 [Tilletia horrida]
MPSQAAELPTTINYAEEALAPNGVYTTSNGVPVAHPYEVLRVGTEQHPDGPLLLQDFHLIDSLSHFDRERIPERVVHAKGGGAHGKFTCTHPIPELTRATLFATKGLETPVTVRFSTVGGESGSPDQARDPRGFSIKFRTGEGNMDWVFNNTPIFFLRDPAKFAHFIHTQKRHPKTHLTHMDDSTNFWDWVGQNPEAIHQMTYLFGPRGIPKTWRHMQGYSGHTFKFIRADGDWVYCQIHILSNQGTENLSSEEAGGLSPDCHQKDLFEAIEKGEFPSWTVKYQKATHEELEAAGVNPFDLTITWDRKKFPLYELGQLELNKNAESYFAEIEQVAFNPAHLVAGFEPSADPVLQSRLFSYPDTHRHRIGPNYQQLPVNAPSGIQYEMYNFQRDGASSYINQGARPNHLSSLNPPTLIPRGYNIARTVGSHDGHAIAYLSGVTAKDFDQARELYRRVFSEKDRATFIKEVSGHMSTCTDKGVLARAISVWHQVDADLAAQIAKGVGVNSYETDLKKMRFIGSHNHEAGLTAHEMIAELHPEKFKTDGKAPHINGQANGNGQHAAQIAAR